KQFHASMMASPAGRRRSVVEPDFRGREGRVGRRIFPSGTTERGDSMAATARVRATVNGDVRESDVEPRLLLIHWLRDNLGLTGAHVGCDTSNCGACTVFLDG